jgi:hypothetical protein
MFIVKREIEEWRAFAGILDKKKSYKRKKVKTGT